ncbi:HlyD family type I secretion periplasmic adaptor subunit [Halomonas eurihalina]|uniref:Membrane fusion protein (MFP) family protein n=2 Tax=Halomonas eurihalina TaxID=42566 RepID=A0A5D9D5C6_HALER|nr:HlyD family type I secretion periplasmic adaptor subunit [Halomonas eurihalina]
MIKYWRMRQQQRAQQAFLPAALEIIQTPASPTCIILLWLICVFAISAALWSYVGHTDIVATALGKLQPQGQVKVVQPSRPGRVKTIAVEDGQKVEKGDVLVTLDNTSTHADVALLEAKLETLEGQIARHRSALETARQWQKVDLWSSDSELIVPTSLPSVGTSLSNTVRTRAYDTYSTDLYELRATLTQLAAQYRQKRMEISSLEDTIGALRNHLQSQRELVGLYASQVASKGVSRAKLLRERGGLEESRISLAQNTGQLATSRSSLSVIAGDIAVAFERFEADNTQRLEEAIQNHDEVVQKLAKARHSQSAMTLTSPIDGVVQALSITTPNQFVAAGVEIMRIVPEKAPLEVVAYLSNKDVGFVQTGQEATLKVQAFPFTRYGLVEGEVVKVATDAITGTRAQRRANNAMQGARGELSTGQAETVQGLVFPITVKPKRDSLKVDGNMVPLSAGMTVQVEIKTGRRRLIDFLFSPLVEVVSQAMSER